MSSESTTYNDATPIDIAVDELAQDDLEGYTGPTWDTEALMRDFEVEGFASPFVVVKRRSDGQRGTLEFVNWPRTCFDFQRAG